MMVFAELLPTDLFKTAASIAGPIGLLGFALAVWLFWQLIRSRGRLQELKSLPEDQRAKHIDEYLTRYGLTSQGLSPKEKMQLIQDEMRRRYNLNVISIVLIVTAVVICFGIAVFGGGPDAPSTSNVELLSTEIRKKVHLTKPGDTPSDTDYLGVSRADFTDDRAYVAIQRMGKYLTPWRKIEAQEKLLVEINKVKDEHRDETVRSLQDFKQVFVVNDADEFGDVTASGIIKDAGPLEILAHPNVDLPPLNKLKYFLEDLDFSGVEKNKASQLITAAIESWASVIPVEFELTSNLAEANVVIACELISAPPAHLGIATIGPPVAGKQYRLALDKAETWNENVLQAVACHELGHILGLRHGDITRDRQLMGDTYYDDIVSPQEEDIAVAQRIWGKILPVPGTFRKAYLAAKGNSNVVAIHVLRDNGQLDGGTIGYVRVGDGDDGRLWVTTFSGPDNKTENTSKAVFTDERFFEIKNLIIGEKQLGPAVGEIGAASPSTIGINWRSKHGSSNSVNMMSNNPVDPAVLFPFK